MVRRLYTFTISHFAEKARWALDHAGLAYEETPLLPGPHFRVIARIAPGTSVPVLVDEGRVVQGSSAIIDYADAAGGERLTPAAAGDRERALEIESSLDRDLGEPLRRFFYFHALPCKTAVIELFSQRGPWWARLFYAVAFPLVAARIRAMYEITADNVARDRELLAATFERLDGLLANRSYLVGDCFSRADLTLAALAAPMWQPREHGTRWPSHLYPPEVLKLQNEFASTRTHDHVMTMYRRHRRPGTGAIAARTGKEG